jgi:lipopolysaccharide transport system permease protein
MPQKKSSLAAAMHYFNVASLHAESSILVSDAERSSRAVLAHGRTEKPTLRIRPSKGWAALNLRELWSYRDLLWILVERDIRLLYKQTALGILWVILQPLIAAVILTIVFGLVAKLPSDGAPYLLFVICGMTVWTYFSQALQRAGNSVVYNAHLVSKVYFPRLLFPLVHILRALIDFVVVLLVLFGLMAVYRVPPTLRLAAIPVLLVFMMLTATGIALWFSALTVKYRDCSNALPYFLQMWMYATPVVYPISMVPQRWHWLFAFNPAVGFIESFRWAVLGHGVLKVDILMVAIIVSLVLLVSGAFFFRRAERGFADII